LVFDFCNHGFEFVKLFLVLFGHLIQFSFNISVNLGIKFLIFLLKILKLRIKGGIYFNLKFFLFIQKLLFFVLFFDGKFEFTLFKNIFEKALLLSEHYFDKLLQLFQFFNLHCKLFPYLVEQFRMRFL
jgi:hypothetical protein